MIQSAVRRSARCCQTIAHVVLMVVPVGSGAAYQAESVPGIASLWGRSELNMLPRQNPVSLI